MSDETEKNKSLWTTLAQLPAVKGPLLGGSVMIAVTPLLTWTNHVLKGERLPVFPLRNLMSGAMSYAVAAAPCYAVTFTCMAGFQKMLREDASKHELVSSTFSGALSGLSCAPFESVAQNQQLTKSTSAIATAKTMIEHNGYGSLLRGSGATVLREGAWSCLYFKAIPMLSDKFQKDGYSKEQAGFLASLFLAGSFGVLSTPLNRLRFQQQDGLTMPKKPKSYWQCSKDLWHKDPAASVTKRLGFFFKGAGPRALTTTAAAGLIVEGGERYDKLVNAFRMG